MKSNQFFNIVNLKPGIKLEEITKIGNILNYDFYKNKRVYGEMCTKKELVVSVDLNKIKVVTAYKERDETIRVYSTERPLKSFSEIDGLFYEHYTMNEFKESKDIFEINGEKDNLYNWAIKSNILE